ncbi:hypothetical protein M153_2200010901 [Pseudoloma neurophilia]|uniref:Uncharacterized protein n=1 Tax=Pseudoloma neurophilia TaxID=146866 RepID=A0A0R0M7Z8_9MICR|nr:hypothetical protein M153_2200010901 [Pseudoloma neurophilia]
MLFCIFLVLNEQKRKIDSFLMNCGRFCTDFSLIIQIFSFLLSLSKKI